MLKTQVRPLAFTAALVLVATLGACGATENPTTDADKGANSASADDSGKAEVVKLTYPILAGGGLGSVPGWYAAESNLDEKYGFDMSFVDYTSPQAFYAAITTGEAELAYGTPDGLVGQAAAGAPIEVFATLSTMSAAIITDEGFAWDGVQSLKGKRFAALEASGTYITMKQFLKDEYGFDIDSEMEVVNAQSLPAGPTQVAAGTADATMNWEPSSTAAIIANPNLKIVYEFGPDYKEKTGEELWHFVLVRNTKGEMSDEQVAAFTEMLAESTKYLTEHPDEADRVAVANGVAAGSFKDAISSGRLNYVVEPTDESIVAQMKSQLARAGVEEGLSNPIPDSFWGEGK